MVYDNNKHMKKLDERFELHDAQFETLSEAIDTKVDKLHALLNQNMEEQQKFFEISFKRNKNYLDISSQFHVHTNEVGEILKKYKNEFNNALISQDNKLKHVHTYKEQLA